MALNEFAWREQEVSPISPDNQIICAHQRYIRVHLRSESRLAVDSIPPSLC
jgi:hypothetical protein